ncbi:MAG TPA: DUF4332 domain-containing protein [Candidatus Limnocylindrales bacterium]
MASFGSSIGAPPDKEDLDHVPPITGLTRIEPVYLDRLEKQGVFTTGILLEVSETPTRRQYLADHIAADLLDVLTWRDEALMLNLAAFGPAEHLLLSHGGFDGLQSILVVDLETFEERVRRAARELKVEAPSELTMTGWWDQARTLESPPEPDAVAPGDVGAVFLRFVLGLVLGGLGSGVASLVAPSDPPLAAVLAVGAVLLVTGVVGRLAAGGMAGFVGLLLGSTILLLALLGRNIVIPLPDTALWHDQGIGFALGPGAGLPGLILGWLGALIARRAGRRSPSTARGTAT